MIYEQRLIGIAAGSVMVERAIKDGYPLALTIFLGIYRIVDDSLGRYLQDAPGEYVSIRERMSRLEDDCLNRAMLSGRDI